MSKINKLIAIILGIMIVATSCKKEEELNEIEELEKKSIFSLFDDETIMLDGVINTKSLVEFNKLYEANKTVKQIKIKNCDGSINDEINLQLSKRVHDLKLNTHLMDNGKIASGGVDFFLAGIKRTAGKNTKIGVHAWSDGVKSATDFDKGHPNHQPYIDYYKYIGFTDAEAKAFYYFTINAATADNIHWMTADEITKYKMLTSEKSYSIEQIKGTWIAKDKSSKDKQVQIIFYDDVIYFGDFKKVQGQWSLLAPEGMNSFRYTIKGNIVYGKLELSNGAIDRYKKLKLNKAMIELADKWSKENAEIFQIISISGNTMKIKALARNGKTYIEETITKQDK